MADVGQPGNDFVDWDRYARGIYTPSPGLVTLAAADPFWITLGGSLSDPFGDGGETWRERVAAATAGIDGYAADGSLR